MIPCLLICQEPFGAQEPLSIRSYLSSGWLGTGVGLCSYEVATFFVGAITRIYRPSNTTQNLPTQLTGYNILKGRRTFHHGSHGGVITCHEEKKTDSSSYNGQGENPCVLKEDRPTSLNRFISSLLLIRCTRGRGQWTWTWQVGGDSHNRLFATRSLSRNENVRRGPRVTDPSIDRRRSCFPLKVGFAA